MKEYKMEILLIVSGALLLLVGSYLAYTKANSIETEVSPPTALEPTASEPQPAPMSNKAKGDAFENYIVSLFDTTSGRFRLIDWRSDKIADNGMYAQNNKHPDLQFEFKGDKRTYSFSIECKWRSKYTNDSIEWAYPAQISNYLNYEKKTRSKVFVVIGVGGSPNEPEEMFVLPLKNIAEYPKVSKSYLQQFKRNPKHKFFYIQHNQTLT